MDKAISSSENSAWGSFYKVAGWAALVMIVYSLVTMVLLLTIGGQPESAQEGFEMLQGNRLIGLLRLDVLTILVMPLYYVLFLGVFVALKDNHIAFAAIAALLGFAGATLFLATPSAFSWLALSDKFAAANTVAQREQLLAAGEALIASDMWHGSGAIMGGFLVQLATTMMSVLMLRSEAFGKFTAYVGIVTHGLDLLHIPLGFFLPSVGFVLLAIAGPLYLVWFPLLARDFFRLSCAESEINLSKA